jgi:hypothetical protein
MHLSASIGTRKVPMDATVVRIALSRQSDNVPVLATSFVMSHTSTDFTFSLRCIILFSASQRHRA